jgi:hypothetical protein
MSPQIGQPDVLEAEYTAKFEALLARHGLFINYRKDLAAVDLGLHLFAPGRATGPEKLSQIKVWFQLKGKNKQALTIEQLATMQSVPVSGLSLETVRFWAASPEPVYLVVYLEATGEFIGEEVQEIMRRHAPTARPGRDDQRTTTLRVRRDAIFNSVAIEQMLHHRTLRLDGPSWRGRPLGHNLDPLRSEIAQMDSTAYRRLVDRLLDVHGYVPTRTIDIAELVEGSTERAGTVMTRGVMTYTYEWTHPLFTEFGFGEDSSFRVESAPLHVQGDCAVLIDARHNAAGLNVEKLAAICKDLQDRDGVKQLLVFINRHHEPSEFGSYRVGAKPLDCIPQELGSLTFNILTATSIYLEFREQITWHNVNYLLDVRKATWAAPD